MRATIIILFIFITHLLLAQENGSEKEIKQPIVNEKTDLDKSKIKVVAPTKSVKKPIKIESRARGHKPAGVGVGRPAGTGKSGNTGRPVGVGKPSKVGGGKGNPGKGQGKPPGVGKPSGGGKPPGVGKPGG